MIKCKECGGDISAKADNCPHCAVVLRKTITYGGLVFKKKLTSVERFAYRLLMIVIIVVVIALVSYVAHRFL